MNRSHLKIFKISISFTNSFNHRIRMLYTLFPILVVGRPKCFRFQPEGDLRGKRHKRAFAAPERAFNRLLYNLYKCYPKRLLPACIHPTEGFFKEAAKMTVKKSLRKEVIYKTYHIWLTSKTARSRQKSRGSNSFRDFFQKFFIFFSISVLLHKILIINDI